MADRKAELERKKKRLEEIRAAKHAKVSSTLTAATSSPNQTNKSSGEQVFPDDSSAGASNNDIDNLLKDLDLASVSTQSPASTNTNRCVELDNIKTASTVTSRRPIKLTVSHREHVSFPPKQLINYEKETQTVVVEERKESVEEKVPKTQQEIIIEPPKTIEREKKKEDAPKMVELSDETKHQILKSPDFCHFFDHAARIIEKAMCEEDFAFDYGAETEMGENDTLASKKLSLSRKFFDERWSKHRCITCMDWSQQHPELLVSSYNQNDDAPQDPDGIALIWNMKYNKHSPEYVFHNQSPIMSICFAQFHPNLLVGGSYSGQIVLWDNRSRKRTPVQKTPLSAAAHTHPVYCVEVIGTQNAHNLITFSTDGKMCSWSLDMLSQPQEAVDLQHTPLSKAVSITSASFLSNDVNSFVVGSEDGTVYTALQHGSKAGIVDQFEGHHGPVTAVDYHAVPGPIDFSHLFLTSSFDWTIKLWSNKDTKVLYSFENNGNYVYDVQWSPIHPALFASVDGEGKLDLWNLNHDTEVPTTSVTVESASALNRVKWARSGHQLAVGDDDGCIYIYEIGEQLADPRPDEYNRFINTLQDIQANALTFSDGERPISPSSSINTLMSPPRL